MVNKRRVSSAIRRLEKVANDVVKANESRQAPLQEEFPPVPRVIIVESQEDQEKS